MIQVQFLGALLSILIVNFSHIAPSNGLEYTPPSEVSNSTKVEFKTTNIPGLERIEFAYKPYKTWGHGIEVKDPLLVAYPKDQDEVVKLINWARKSGRKVRPTGYKHSFPPLTVTQDTDASKVVLVDLTKHFTKLEMTEIPPEKTVNNKTIKAVTAETGTSWEDFMRFCEKNNVGIAHSIIIGDATVGGVLAIGGHGAGIAAKNETQQTGFSFGSLSNLIAAFKAVVWDAEQNTYHIRSFSRSDTDASAFLVHVGRAFLTQVTLIVGENYNLRCKSITDIPAEELFADTDINTQHTRTFTSFLDETGRADIQWYQFTKNPWLKVWNVEKEKPSSCFEVFGPYNYQFPVNVKIPEKTVPELGEIAYNNLLGGLSSTNASDIWGPSKNILLYSNGSSQSIVYGGFVVLTSRDRIQTVLSTVVDFYKNLTNEYAEKSQYPIDYYIKFRVTGIDYGSETLIKNAVNPSLSPVSPHPDYPEFDTALWMNTFTARENPLGSIFMSKFESFYFTTFNGRNGVARPEWSKSWAYSADGPFLNETMLSEIIPSRYGRDWQKAISILDKYDPDRLFTNSFLDVVLK